MKRHRIKTTGQEGDAVSETAAPPSASPAGPSCEVNLAGVVRTPAAYVDSQRAYQNAAVVLSSGADAVQVSSDGRAMVAVSTKADEGAYMVPLGAVTARSGTLVATPAPNDAMVLAVPKGKNKDIVSIPSGGAPKPTDKNLPAMVMPVLLADLPNNPKGLVWRSFPAKHLLQALEQVGGEGTVGIAFCGMPGSIGGDESHQAAVIVSQNGLAVVMPYHDASMTQAYNSVSAGEVAAEFSSKFCKLWWRYFPGHRHQWNDRAPVRRAWCKRYGRHTDELDWATGGETSFKLVEIKPRGRWASDREGGE